MTNAILRGCLFIGGAAALLLWTAPDSFGLEVNKPVPTERREAMSLADAVLKALQNNLDISIGRQTRESRLADIVIEQAKFDPTVSLNGQYNRQVSPLNRPILGFTGANLQEITKFDQNSHSLTAGNLPRDRLGVVLLLGLAGDFIYGNHTTIKGWPWGRPPDR